MDTSSFFPKTFLNRSQAGKFSLSFYFIHETAPEYPACALKDPGAQAGRMLT
jgi:hypothetical protein